MIEPNLAGLEQVLAAEKLNPLHLVLQVYTPDSRLDLPTELLAITRAMGKGVMPFTI
jgi:hypothetical protein